MRLARCYGSGSGTCLQDTLKTSLCVNRLFPTARLSCKQVPEPSLKRRLPISQDKSIESEPQPVREVAGVSLQDPHLSGTNEECTGKS